MSDPLIEKINETLDNIQRKVDDLQNALNDTLGRIPGLLGWVADKILDAWNWFVGKLQEFWDWISNFLQHMGDPDRLTSTADAWSQSVGGPVSARVGTADVGSLMVDDNWTGTAAEQYRQQVPLQKTALQSVKFAFTDGISGALKDVALAIKVWWAALAGALVALAIALIEAIGAALGIITAPAAPLIAAGGVAVCASLLWGGGEVLKSQSASANVTLNQKLAENAAYPNGAWPKAVL